MTHPGQSDSERRKLWNRNSVAHTFGDPHNWGSYRKRSLVKAIIVGPLSEGATVVTLEGAIDLPKGWIGAIAIDSEGAPYPIAMDVFRATYEMAS